jgi:4-hydroxybenzoate polyprenyltransferase
MGWMKNIFVKIALFLEMIKFEHSIFALPFAYAGLFMAGRRWPDLPAFVWVTIAMVSFRTMAMGLNRLFDRSIDALNPRTGDRALPQNKIRISTVWSFVILSLMVFEWSAYQLGALCFWLSPLSIMLAVLYPFAKRFTWLSHFVLGLILGIAPYGAWIAVTGQFAWAPAFLTLGVIGWVAGFDMIYALQDIDFDIKHGLFSFPARFGIANTLRLTRGLHILSVVCWALGGFLGGMGMVYGLGLAVAAFFLIREHQLVRSFGIAKMNEAFFLMNGVVSVTLFLAVAFDISLKRNIL